MKVRYFFDQFLGNYFAFDSKLLRTLIPLITKPGVLSLHFISGKRIRYISPVQLYIFVSFLYFFSLHLLKVPSGHDSRVTITKNDSVITLDNIAEQRETLEKIVESDTTGQSLSKTYIRNILKFSELDEDTRKQKMDLWLSYMLFLLMPFIALISRWLYGRSKRHYFENLIFILHVFSFLFLVAIVNLLIRRWILPGLDPHLEFWVAPVYLLIATMRFFKIKWLAALPLMIVFMSISAFFVAVGIILAIMISIFV